MAGQWLAGLVRGKAGEEEECWEEEEEEEEECGEEEECWEECWAGPRPQASEVR